MAKVTYIDPVEHISGKIAKKHKSVYSYRKDINCKYISQPRPSSVPPTSDQLALREEFARTVARVNQTMADEAQVNTYKEQFENQSKYKTLRGYIFAQMYNETV